MPASLTRERMRLGDLQTSSRRTFVHIEDSAEDAYLMQGAFVECGADLTYQWISDGTSAMSFIDGITSDSGAVGITFLIDVNIPLVNGIDIVRHLRAHTFLRRAPIIMLSTSQQQFDQQLALMHGAVEYVVKPGHVDGWVALARHLDERYV